MNVISAARFNEIIQQFNRIKPILVVGDVGVDKYTYGEVRRISPEAPVPVLEVSKEWRKLGLASNVSDNLKALGVESTLCGLIGHDANGTVLESLLEEAGLKTWGIVRSEERLTTFKERVTTKTQQICRVDYEISGPASADCMAKIKKRVEDFKDDHSCVIIEDYCKGLINKSLCEYIISSYKDLGKMVIVDPGSKAHPDWYRGASLLKPNLNESRMLSEALGYRDENIESMAELLVDKLELEMLVMTLGSEGMAIIDKKTDGKLKYIPTIRTEVYDVSGAGDTAVSCIAAALCTGATLEEAAWMGICGSGVVVGKKGTASVSGQELMDFYKDRLIKL